MNLGWLESLLKNGVVVCGTPEELVRFQAWYKCESFQLAHLGPFRFIMFGYLGWTNSIVYEAEGDDKKLYRWEQDPYDRERNGLIHVLYFKGAKYNFGSFNTLQAAFRIASVAPTPFFKWENDAWKLCVDHFYPEYAAGRISSMIHYIDRDTHFKAASEAIRNIQKGNINGIRKFVRKIDILKQLADNEKLPEKERLSSKQYISLLEELGPGIDDTHKEYQDTLYHLRYKNASPQDVLHATRVLAAEPRFTPEEYKRNYEAVRKAMHNLDSPGRDSRAPPLQKDYYERYPALRLLDEDLSEDAEVWEITRGATDFTKLNKGKRFEVNAAQYLCGLLAAKSRGAKKIVALAPPKIIKSLFIDHGVIVTEKGKESDLGSEVDPTRDRIRKEKNERDKSIVVEFGVDQAIMAFGEHVKQPPLMIFYEYRNNKPILRMVNPMELMDELFRAPVLPSLIWTPDQEKEQDDVNNLVCTPNPAYTGLEYRI